jgi:lipopolysaccharide transport protein LptA
MILSRPLLATGLALLFPLLPPLAAAEDTPPAMPAEVAPAAASSAAPPAEGLSAEERSPATVIESDSMEMVTTDEETRFVFSNNVRVTGNNLTVHCDRLEVLSARHDNDRDAAPELGRIQTIFALGNVRIQQETRLATAGRAELFPQEGKIVLLDSPMIIDDQGRVSGERITLYQGESRAVVDSGEGRPARIILPSLPDLDASGERRSSRE